ncbi:MAG: M23 family metallopeptidase [Spirochaeta sp.]|jgi:murein DD-endopeptidase MepM/ murein hydrolase activator NlpD|nr:M23 family metallopeptidase [Spirochaeta sp.]
MKLNKRYTLTILFETTRSPISFSVSLASLVGALVFVSFISLTVIYLARIDVGQQSITERQSERAAAQANLDAVLMEVDRLEEISRSFDDEVEPLTDLLVPSQRNSDLNPLSIAPLRLQTFFEDHTDDTSKLPSYVDHLAEKLYRSASLLSDARQKQTMLSQVLRDIPNAWPVGGNRGGVSMEFGPNIHPITGQWYLHKGFDIAGYPGTPILASAAGVVTVAGYDPGYGFQVVIRHKYGYSTRYPHMREISVSAGQQIDQGDVVGTMGRTGIATGTHLHFEVILGNEVVDPAPFLKISNTFRRGGYNSR